MSKKILSFVLCMLMFVGVASGFSDLEKDHWAREIIERVSTERPDVIKGYPDGTVRPEGTVTREEFVKMVVTGKGLEKQDDSKADFVDIENKWSEGYIHAAVKDGIVTPDKAHSSFSPADEITREDMARYTVKALGYNVTGADEPEFDDREDISTGYEKYVSVAVEKELIKGYPGNTFKPKDSLTRAEAFTVICRYLDQLDVTDKDFDEEKPVLELNERGLPVDKEATFAYLYKVIDTIEVDRENNTFSYYLPPAPQGLQWNVSGIVYYNEGDPPWDDISSSLETDEGDKYYTWTVNWDQLTEGYFGIYLVSRHDSRLDILVYDIKTEETEETTLR